MNSKAFVNKKLYLLITVIVLAVVSIFVTFSFMKKNDKSIVAQVEPEEAKEREPMGNNSGASGAGNPNRNRSGRNKPGRSRPGPSNQPGSSNPSGKVEENEEDDNDATPYPFRIFFTRSDPAKGPQIFSMNPNGTDKKIHTCKGSEKGSSYSELITSNTGSKLVFCDHESIKVFDLVKDKITDLKIKGSNLSLSSDDKKLAYISSENPSELVIFDIKSKKAEFKKDFGKGNLPSAPQFLPKDENSEIIFNLKSGHGSSINKLDIKTGNIQDFKSITDNVRQFKLSPDGKLLAFVTNSMPLYLKIYNLETGKVDDCFNNWNGLLLFRWSIDSKSIYLSVSDTSGDYLNEYKLGEKVSTQLKDETGNKISCR